MWIKVNNTEDKFSKEIETLKKYRNIGNEKLNVNNNNKTMESIPKRFDQVGKKMNDGRQGKENIVFEYQYEKQ